MSSPAGCSAIVVSAPAPVVDDEAHGSVELMRARSPDQLSSASGSTVHGWFEELAEVPEYAKEFSDWPGLKNTHGWRMATRICCINTSRRNKPNLKKATAQRLTRGLLGSQRLCAPESVLADNDPAKGFWVAAIALSLHLKVLISPKRAFCMFARHNSQGYKVTDYGESLLQRASVSWPPCPDFLNSFVDPNDDILSLSPGGSPKASSTPRQREAFWSDEADDSADGCSTPTKRPKRSTSKRMTGMRPTHQARNRSLRRTTSAAEDASAVKGDEFYSNLAGTAADDQPDFNSSEFNSVMGMLLSFDFGADSGDALPSSFRHLVDYQQIEPLLQCDEYQQVDSCEYYPPPIPTATGGGSEDPPVSHKNFGGDGPAPVRITGTNIVSEMSFLMNSFPSLEHDGAPRLSDDSTGTLVEGGPIARVRAAPTVAAIFSGGVEGIPWKNLLRDPALRSVKSDPPPPMLWQPPTLYASGVHVASTDLDHEGFRAHTAGWKLNTAH